MDQALLFTTLGLLFLAGLATDILGRATRLPRVSLLLLFGFLIGPSGLDILPELGSEWRSGITHMALVMVGFLLGEHLSLRRLRRHGRAVLWVSGTMTLATVLLVSGGLLLLGQPLILALFCGGIATATDPIATADGIRESEAQGPMSETLLGVVAIDDVWGLLCFTLILTLAESISGQGGVIAILGHALYDLGGALLIGMLLGLAMAALTGRLRPGEPTQAEALGFVFVCAGLTLWAEVSFMLAAMILGLTVANRAHHHQYPFNAIEGIEWPFLILFFLLAGASLQIGALLSGGFLALAYILLRIGGRLLGNALGAWAAGADPQTRRYLGLAALPQAGVATGMALIAAERFPVYAEQLISLVIGTTVVFELFGPIATRYALRASGEAGQGIRTEREAG